MQQLKQEIVTEREKHRADLNHLDEQRRKWVDEKVYALQHTRQRDVDHWRRILDAKAALCCTYAGFFSIRSVDASGPARGRWVQELAAREKLLERRLQTQLCVDEVDATKGAPTRLEAPRWLDGGDPLKDLKEEEEPE